VIGNRDVEKKENDELLNRNLAVPLSGDEEPPVSPRSRRVGILSFPSPFDHDEEGEGPLDEFELKHQAEEADGGVSVVGR